MEGKQDVKLKKLFT